MHFARRGMPIDPVLTGGVEVELQKLIALPVVIDNGRGIWSDLHRVPVEQDAALFIPAESGQYAA